MTAGLRVACSALLLAGAGLSLLGWGMLARRVTRTAGSWPTTIALGLSGVLVVGGLLNLARIAYAPALWAAAAGGLLLLALDVKSPGRLVAWARSIRQRRPAEWAEDAVTGAFIGAVLVFTTATQLPPDVFNYDDDLQKYFAHPVRMLATGTLTGSPMSALGSRALGGMAFLHGFVVSAFPIELLNGVDAVFGLGLLLCLGAAAGWRRLTPLPGALFAPLLLVWVNPQYVNVTALFLGAALMAGAVLLASDPREAWPPRAASLGLLYGGLVALKPTFAVFAAVHAPLVAAVIWLQERSVREGLMWLLRTLLAALLVSAPWFLLHVPSYLRLRSMSDVQVPAVAPEHFSIFSTAPLSYGGSMAAYTALVALALLAAAWGLAAAVGPGAPAERRRSWGLVASAVSPALVYAFLVWVAAPHEAGYENSVRYATPFLLGVVPFAAVLAAGARPPFARGLSVAVPLVALLASCAWFAPSLQERVARALQCRTILAFSRLACEPSYRAYIRWALSRSEAEQVRKLQEMVPAGEPFIAWIANPFYLDFARNPVHDAEACGLSTPWGAPPEDVRYVVWEYRGFATPTAERYAVLRSRSPGRLSRVIADRAWSFARRLEAEADQGGRLYDDGRFVVLRLAGR